MINETPISSQETQNINEKVLDRKVSLLLLDSAALVLGHIQDQGARTNFFEKSFKSPLDYAIK
jgi:hypothetical protein